MCENMQKILSSDIYVIYDYYDFIYINIDTHRK